MAEEYLDLSLNLDVADAEKTAKNLKKEIEDIFNSGKGEKSSSMTRLEQQMKANYNTAEQLRASLEEVGAAISRTEGYISAQREIERMEGSISHMFRTIEHAEAKHPISIDSLLGKESFDTSAQVEKEIQTTTEAITEAQKLGYETGALQNRLAKLQAALIEHNALVNESTINYNGMMMTVGELKQLYDSTVATMQNMKMEQREMFGTTDVDSETALGVLQELNQTYNQLAVSMDNVNDREKQQIIAHREMERREQERIAKEEERVAKERQKEQQERQRVHDRLEAHKLEQQIAEEQWKKAVEQQELEATISQQHQQQIAEEQRLQEEARKTAEAERDARLATIEANSNFMTLMMGVRSIAGLIPGVATRAVSSVLSIVTVLRRFKDVTWASLKTAILTGLKEIWAALSKLFSFILHNPIVVVIAAAIAAIILLINKLKEMWDETEQQVDAIIDRLGDALTKLKDLAIDFAKGITQGFLKIGNFVPSIFLRLTQKLISKLKSLKGLVQENIDAMAKWNDGNNAINKALSNITSSLAYLKASITAAIAPILVYVEPVLTRVLDTLGKIFEVIGMIIAKLTGATTFQRAIRKQKDYAKSLSETNGQLASFDKLNVISQNKGEAVDFGIVNLEDIELPDWLDDLNQLGKKLGKTLKKFLKDLNWDKIKEEAGKLGTSISDFINGFFQVPDIGATIGKTLGEGLNTITSFINNFINNLDGVSLGTQLGAALQTMVTTVHWDELGDIFSGSINKIAEIVKNFAESFHGEDLGIAFTTFLRNALGGIKWDLVRESISEVVKDIAGFFNETITVENFELIGTTLGELLNTIMTGIDVFADKAKWTDWGESVAAGIIKVFETTDFTFSAKAIGKLVIGILDGILAAVNKLTDPENLDKIIDAILDFFENVPWQDIKERALAISQKLRDGLTKIWNALVESGAYDDIIGFIVDFLQEKSNWDKLFEGFKKDVVGDIFWGKIKGMFERVGQHIANAINAIITFIVDSWNNITSFGDVISGKLSFDDWLHGNTSNIKTHSSGGRSFSVEGYANGAVLPPNKPFLGILGDQKYGTNVEAPLSTIKQAVAEVMGDMGIKVVFDVQGDPNRIFKATQKEARIYYNQTGMNAFAN